jgi:hypothetical protein
LRTLSTELIKSGSFTGSFTGSTLNVSSVTSSNISASNYISGSNIWGLSLVINGVAKIFDSVYAYAGITGSLSGSSVTSTIGNFTYLTASSIRATSSIINTGSFNYLSINNTGSAPTNPTASGTIGEIRFDNNFIYIYTNQKWIRSPISLWNP